MKLPGTTLRFGLWISGIAVLSMFSPELVSAQNARENDVLNLLAILPSVPAGAGQGGRRGPAPPDPAAAFPAQGAPGGARGGRGEVPAVAQPAAWWTNAALVARLGLTEDQKKNVEAIFERYRQTLVQNKLDLEREEAALAGMLEAEPVQSVNVVTAQIDRVVQARGEMERTNSKMTLEIRQALTRAQWLQLQAETLQPAAPAAGQRRGGARRGGPTTPVPPPNP